MKKKCAFTIVAKNYIGLGLILEQSIRKYYSDFDFYIVVADEPSATDLPQNVIIASRRPRLSTQRWLALPFL